MYPPVIGWSEDPLAASRDPGDLIADLSAGTEPRGSAARLDRAEGAQQPDLLHRYGAPGLYPAPP